MTKLIKIYLNVMGRPSNLLLTLLFGLALSLTGCSSPKISTAQTAAKVDTEIAKMELLKTSLATMRDSLRDLRVDDSKPDAPEPLHLFTLDTFLKENDCRIYLGVVGDIEKANECYRITVVRLINETNYADYLGSLLYDARVKNYQYWLTVNQMLDTLGIPNVSSKLTSVKDSTKETKSTTIFSNLKSNPKSETKETK